MNDVFRASDGWTVDRRTFSEKVRADGAASAAFFALRNLGDEHRSQVTVHGYGPSPEAAEAAAVKAWNEATAARFDEGFGHGARNEGASSACEVERIETLHALKLAAAEARIAELERLVRHQNPTLAHLVPHAPHDALREFGERVARQASFDAGNSDADAEQIARAIVARAMGKQREAR